jgi:hypothetical protein
MPLLVYKDSHGKYAMVTTSMLSSQFRDFINILGYPPLTFSMHSLRKGGATLAHTAGIPVDHIMTHGTWTSNAVWKYLKPSAATKTAIPDAMAKAIQ